MYPVSEAFKERLGVSHTMVTRIEVLEGGLALPDVLLKPIEGSVSVEARNKIRRRCGLQVVSVNGELTPKEARDLLHPLSGHELKVYRGVVLADGTEEAPPQGVFRIKGSKVRSTNEGVVVSINGQDRARRVIRARLADFYPIPAGAPLADFILDLISPTLDPDQVYSFENTDFTLPGGVLDPQTDRWEWAQKVAFNGGMDLYFDQDGVPTLRTTPDYSTVPVSFEYGDNAAIPLLLDDEREVDEEGVFNHVVVNGAGPNVPVAVRAEAMDTDQASPTYVDGDFGDVVTFYTSDMIHTEGQAQATADAILQRKIGSLEVVAFTSMVNSAHDADDVVLLTSEDTGTDDRYILDAFTMPMMEDGTMPCTTRRRPAA